MVEAAVRNHLVHHIPAEVRAAAVGVGWWLGRLASPYASNFEFGLHREIGQDQETGALESRMLSSVMYLADVDDGPLVFGGEPSPDAQGYQPGDLAAEPMKHVAAVYDGSMYPELQAAVADSQISS